MRCLRLRPMRAGNTFFGCRRNRDSPDALHLNIWQGARDRHGFIVACVVDDNDQIDNAMRHHFIVSLTQCACRVIRGHHHYNFLAV